VSTAYPWYDSPWLTSYVRAKDYVFAYHPERLDEFVASFDVLRTDPDFEVKQVRDMLSGEDHARLKALIVAEAGPPLERHEVLSFGRLIVHDAELCAELQAKLTDRIGELVGESVEPCYNFLSLYNNLGVCAVHMDAPSTKWTFDYCIEQSAPWPIQLSQVRPWPEEWRHDGADWDAAIRADPDNHFTPFTLQEGEAIVFAGSSQWHYRDRIAQRTATNFCHLVFFHYVPTGTQHLTDPRRWAEHFGIPGLAGVIAEPKKVDPNVIA
jgi:hypothetical protein